MTLEEFRATRRRVDSLANEIGVETYGAGGEVVDKAGYVYAASLYIEIESDGQLSLTIEGDSWFGINADLPEFEARLHAYGIEACAFN